MPEMIPLYQSSTPNEDLAVAPDGFGYHFLVTLPNGREAEFVLNNWIASDNTVSYFSRRGHTFKVLPLAYEPDEDFLNEVLGL